MISTMKMYGYFNEMGHLLTIPLRFLSIWVKPFLIGGSAEEDQWIGFQGHQTWIRWIFCWTTRRKQYINLNQHFWMSYDKGLLITTGLFHLKCFKTFESALNMTFIILCTQEAIILSAGWSENGDSGQILSSNFAPLQGQKLNKS